MHLTLLSPLGLLLSLGVLVPLAALAVAERRAARVGRLLRLTRPDRRRRAEVGTALLATAALLAIAAAQPVVGSSQARHVDEDAQAVVVFDVSQSMDASLGPHSPTRLDRAKALALRLRRALGPDEVGAASMTGRTLPYLFPTADERTFEQVVRQSVAIGSPPPGAPTFAALLSGRRDLASDLGSLGAIPTQSYFTPAATRRLVVVLSDDESQPLSASSVAVRFHMAPPVHLISVRFWNAGERIYGPRGEDPRYRPDPSSAETARQLAALTGGKTFDEHDFGAIVRAARADLAGGRVVTQTLEQTQRPLAAWFAAAALLPLALVLYRRNV